MNNKLQNIKLTFEEWNTKCSKNRSEQVVVTCLYIGHTNITHHYLWEGTTHPQYAKGDLQWNNLLECIDFDLARTKNYQASNLKKKYQRPRFYIS